MRRRLPSSRTITAGLLVAAAFCGAAAAERGDDANRASKNGRTDGVVDGVEITIEYGRPNVKGREIWGALVPYDRVWRTGADEATTIAFAGPVMVGGQALAAGRYGLFTIPGEGEWTVILNRVADQWGAYGYDAGEDALRIQAVPEDAEFVESLSFAIDEGRVVLRWERLAVAFEIGAGS